MSFEKWKKISKIVIYFEIRVISYSSIRDFIKVHPDCSVALRCWYRRLARKKPGSIHELKMAFPGVDYIGNKRFVFNIKGNKYRVVALILFGPQKAYIRYIGTHADYDKTNCKEI